MLGIVFSLGSGMYYLLFAKESSKKSVKALTVRISLSLGLFILLFIAFAMGWIRPHSLLPSQNEMTRTSTQRQTGTATRRPQSANTIPPPQNQSDVQQ